MAKKGTGTTTYKSWEQPYKNGKIKEDQNQYEIFQIYEKLGPTRSIKKLWEYQYTKEKIVLHNEVQYPKHMRTLYKWRDKFCYDERISEKIGYISQKVTEQTLEENIRAHKEDLKHRLRDDKQINKIDDILDEYLEQIKEGKTQLFKFMQLSVEAKSRIKNGGINTTKEINELNNIIGNLNKALHPENKRDGLKTLAESIRESLEKLDEK